jgi:hypothetical protein
MLRKDLQILLVFLFFLKLLTMPWNQNNWINLGIILFTLFTISSLFIMIIDLFDIFPWVTAAVTVGAEKNLEFNSSASVSDPSSIENRIGFKQPE